MGRRLPAANIITDQYPYPFSALEDFILKSGAYIIVPDRASLATREGLDGQHAFSLKARDEWIANTTDPGPAVPGEKIAMPGGGFWVRTQYADAQYRSRIDAPGVPAWTIDALVGDDEAVGTPAAPIKTHAEFSRRIGNFAQWKLQGDVTVTYTSIAAMPPSSDPFPVEDAPQSDSPPTGVVFFLTFQGPAPVAKAGHGGVITGVTPRVRATNTPWGIVTTGILDASDVGLRMEITAGPRAGAVTYPDRVTGANAVDTSEWQIADLGPTVAVDTHVNPTLGDNVQVFNQGLLFVNTARFRGSSQGSLVFKDLDFSPVNAGDPMQFFADGGGIMFVYCRFLDASDFRSTTQEANAGFFWGLLYQLACCAIGGTNNQLWPEGDYQTNIINGGLYHGAVIANGGSLQWDADAMCTGGAVGATQGGFFIVGAGSAYRAPATAGFNVGSKSLLRSSLLFYGVRATYGQGNALAGVLCAERMTYDNAPTLATITVAGPPGIDFVLTVPGTSFFFDPATGAFAPAGGLASTWANMAIAQPAGLGGEAHNPARSSEIIQASPLTFP